MKLKAPLKKQCVMYLCLLMAMPACSVKDTEDYKAVVSYKNYLEDQIKIRETELEGITNSMVKIEKNLVAIRTKEGLVTQLTKKGRIDRADQINSVIKDIGIYMDENRQIMTSLEKKLKTATKKNNGLVNLLEQQKVTIEEKERQIAQLTNTVDSLQTTLTTTIAVKDAEIRKRDTELTTKQQLLAKTEEDLATGFLRFGTKEELLADGLIRQEGKFLGLSKSLKLTYQFNKNQFESINIRKTSELNIGSVNKPVILSSHPLDSYYFLKSEGRTFLRITNQEKFWSVSKYLVIVTDVG